MKKLIITPLVLLLGLCACDDHIDLEPQDKITMEEFFANATANDLKLFSNRFYGDLQPNASDKEDFELEWQDDCKVNATLSAIMKGGTNRTVPQSGGGWSWTVLRNINTLLENVDKCSDKDAVRQYTALGRFFRAYFYSQKVIRFGDVPWIDRQLASNDPLLKAPRDSREFILTKMIEDIDYAIENLPVKEKESSAPYRATKGAALALKSNFCLFEGTFRKYHNLNLEGHDWKYYLQQSVDACEKLMSGSYGKYKLYSTGNPKEDYMMLFANFDASKDEFILAVRYDMALRMGHNGNAHTTMSTQGQPGFTRKFVCSYLMDDGSRFTDRNGWQTMPYAEEVKGRDPRLAQSIRTPGYHRIGETDVLSLHLGQTRTGYQPIKFVSQQWVGSYDNDRSDFSCNDLPTFRYGETLLNYAEAKAELGTLTQNDIDKTVNELRKRVGMKGMLDKDFANAHPDPYLLSEETGYFNVSGENSGVILEIRRERAIEMVMEGRRINDLMRWKCGKMIDQSLQGMYIAGSGEYDFSGNGQIDVILYPEGGAKPKVPDGATAYEIGKGIVLSEGSYGFTDYHRNQVRFGFDETRDYLYPIPINDRSLNPNLTQNPGWEDGLSK